MLTSLFVRHFAVIDRIEVDLTSGLTVVTGQTGAGKSLLVDALMLLAGARADLGLIRAGCERAELQAGFDLGALPQARRWLARQEMDEDGQCQLRRVLKAAGGSRAWINGRPATLQQMSDLTGLLLEIHGQHEHQALLHRRHQLTLLDAFAGNEPTREQVAGLARRWRELQRQRDALTGGPDPAARIELLRHEVEALEQWALSATDLAALTAEHKRLANAEQLLAGAARLVERIDGDTDFAVRKALAHASAELDGLAATDPRLQPAQELLTNALIQLGEAADAISHYADHVDLDPARYEEADAHLGHIHELARRHQVPEDELDAKGEALRTELDALENAGTTLARLDAETAHVLEQYNTLATSLSTTRQHAAKMLGQQVTSLMQELGMNGGVFAVSLPAQSDSEPDPSGRERCEFLVSANPGQPPRPLRKVASGGELARIGLALEVATLGMDEVGTMVFDEVDTGIGGAVAEVVGHKLRTLGEHRQVLCVTHLPQVAAQGHHHLHVEKDPRADATDATINALDEAARGEELARMLGGIHITAETRAHARKMLQHAQADTAPKPATKRTKKRPAKS